LFHQPIWGLRILSELFKSKKKLGMMVGTIFLSLTLVSGVVAGILLNGAAGSGLPVEQPEVSDISEGEPAPDLDELLPAELEPEPEIIEPVYNVPGEMRGVYLVPGSDFLTSLTATPSAIQAEVDKAVEEAAKLTMNSVIIDTVYNDKVIFETSGAPRLEVGFDVMEYVVDAARNQGLYVYAIFDASLFQGKSGGASLTLGAGTIDKLTANLREFAEKYAPDAILMDGYTQPTNEEQNYIGYLMTGGAIGYDNFLRQTPAAMVRNMSNTIRHYAPNIQVGLLADAVWASDAEQEGGVAVKSVSFSSLGNGNADTKAFVEDGVVDFVAVKAFSSLTDPNEPFETVVTWWADVARRSGVPMFVVHAASKACTQNTGWGSYDQLTRQVIRASGLPGYSGSVFNSLSRLVANPQDTTATLVKYYKGEVKSEHVLTELAITKPTQTTYTTQEPSVTFTGASDPTSPVTINGQEITTDASGYFTVKFDLKGGENTFTIVHKSKTLTYKITRNIEILKEVAPTGTISTDGNMSIKISALAYEDAEVYATIGGSTVAMEIDESAEDEAARDSNYKRFVGYYTAPAGTTQEQNLGAITITAAWQGTTKSLKGATVKVNKKAKLENGVPVVVVADQAWTYPPNTLDNVPNPNYYPIPKGAMDYAVGDEITYVSSKGESFQFYKLASGLRVESKDIQAITNDYVGGNAISGFHISTEGRYVYLTIKTAQKVTYKVAYTGSTFGITFHNTDKNPGGSQSLDQNPLFTKATWGSDNLTLTLAKSGGFLGFKGYYDSKGNLVFRFNIPPSSLNGARIAVDAGHGGSDTGALGFLAAYPEKVINRAIAEMLADELESRGATVLLIDNSGNPSLQNRVRQAEAFNADLFVSVHNNTGTRASAVGTEAYYFYPYSKNTAAAIAAQVSSRLGSENRGARQSYYHITLTPQMPAILAECGFMTNKGEYEKLIKEEYQQAIAIGLADGLAAGLKSAYTGVTTTGSQSVGSGVDPTTDSGNSSVGSSQVEYLVFENEELAINEGATYTLRLISDPEDADLSGMTFKSSNTSVATVNSQGKVTAVKLGKAKITATTADGRVTAVCQLEVVERGGEQDYAEPVVPPTKTAGASLKSVSYIEFYDEYVTLGKNASYTLKITSDKGLVKNTDLLWKSEDASVATVDSNGKVTAKSTGYTEIYAYTANHDYSISCAVEVVSGKIAVKGISLDQTKLYMKRGTEQQLYVNFKPETATNKGVSWTSSRQSVATVDEYGKVTAKSAGTAVITATSKDGRYTATCTVEVTTKTIKVDYISFEYSEMEPYVGDITQLEYSIGPDNATDLSVTFKSSNPSVVSVDEQGFITCHKKGKAVITVTSVSNPRSTIPAKSG
jgi:uncharacterized protein YjdB/N-acetylmuramoyl-L-alanine amidase/uncharacterized lipoprotein YddW (UPF0748 family)